MPSNQVHSVPSKAMFHPGVESSFSAAVLGLLPPWQLLLWWDLSHIQTHPVCFKSVFPIFNWLLMLVPGERSGLSAISHTPPPNLPLLQFQLHHRSFLLPQLHLNGLHLHCLPFNQFFHPSHSGNPRGALVHSPLGAFAAFAGPLLRPIPTPYLTFHRFFKHSSK